MLDTGSNIGIITREATKIIQGKAEPVTKTDKAVGGDIELKEVARLAVKRNEGYN